MMGKAEAGSRMGEVKGGREGLESSGVLCWMFLRRLSFVGNMLILNFLLLRIFKFGNCRWNFYYFVVFIEF